MWVVVVTILLLSCVCCTPVAHPQRVLRHHQHRGVASFVQSHGVFDDADGMGSLTTGGIVDASAFGILKEAGTFQEEAPMASHPVQSASAVQVQSAMTAHPVGALSLPLSSPSSVAPVAVFSAPPSTLPLNSKDAAAHVVQGPLVEAEPPSVSMQELPPAENDESGPGSGNDANDLMATAREIMPEDAGLSEAITFEGEVEMGLRPVDATQKPTATQVFPTNPPGNHGSIQASQGRFARSAVARKPSSIVHALSEKAERRHRPLVQQHQQRLPWRAADWGVEPSSFRPRAALARKKITVSRVPSKSSPWDGPVGFMPTAGRFLFSRPDDVRFGPPKAYITQLDEDLAKAKAPLSPSVVSRPKGWDQCLRFVREIKRKGVRGNELVKTFKGTCMPSIYAGQATERFTLMCHSIGGALDPFVAQIDYRPEDVCNAVLVIFHDVNAVDSKPGSS